MMSIGRFLTLYHDAQIMFDGLGCRTGYEWKRYFQSIGMRMTSVMFGINLNPNPDYDVHAWIKQN